MSYTASLKAQFSRNAAGQANVASGAFGSAATANNALLVIVAYYASAARQASISRGTDAFSSLISGAASFNATAQAGVMAYVAPQCAAGTTQVTATFQNTSGAAANVDYPAIAVVELSGLRTSGISGATPVLVLQSNPGTASGAVASGNITPSAAPAAVVAIAVDLGNQAGPVPATGNGYTGLGTMWNYEGTATVGAQIEHKRVLTTAQTNATWTTDPNGGGSAFLNLILVLLEPATGIDLAGSAADVATATASLTTQQGVSASAADVATATGALTTQIPVAAAAADVASATAGLTVTSQHLIFRSESHGTDQSFAVNNVNVAKPAGTAQDDLLDATFVSILAAPAAAPTHTLPDASWHVAATGTFTMFGGAYNGRVTRAYKIAGASEGDSYTFTASANSVVTLAIKAYDNPDTANPFNTASAVTQFTGTSDLSCPSVTTTTDYALVVGDCLSDGTTGVTVNYTSSALTEHVDALSLWSGDALQPVAGASGAKAVTASSGGAGFTVTVAYNSASSVSTNLVASTAAVIASASAALTTQVRMGAGAANTVSAAASLTTAIRLAMAAISNVTASGGLSTAVKLTAAALGNASASANLGGGVLISGNATSVASATAALTTAIRMGASASDIASMAADLATKVVLSGNANDIATATAALTVGAQFQASLLDVVTATAALTTKLQLGANAVDNAVASGTLTNWATVTLGSSLYTGQGGALDPNFWTGSVPHAGTTLYYDASHITIYNNAEISSDTNNCVAAVQFKDDLGEWQLGLIFIVPDIAASARSQAGMAGQLTSAIQLSAAATALSTISASLSTNTGIFANAQTTASGVASLTTDIRVSAAIEALATANAALTSQIKLLANFASQAGATATLDGFIVISANAQAAASASASLTTNVALGAIAQAASNAFANMTTGIPMQAFAFNIANASGALSSQRLFTAAAIDIATAAAVMNTGISLNANAQGIADALAEMITSIDLVSFAAAQSSATATLGSVGDQPQPSGVRIAITGSATYTRVILGSAPLMVH